MYWFAFIVSLLTLVIVLSPLVLSKGGHLASASSLNSPERLEAVKKALVKRFIEDEKAFEQKAIPKIVWEQRKQFLYNRYIDAARRLDYIQDIVAHQNHPQSKGGKDS